MSNENFGDNISNAPTVVVALSGGVDSSVALLLLKNQGYNVIGLHMKNADPDAEAEDEKMLLSICEKLGVECRFIEYNDEMSLVKKYFVDEYKLGRTPNPCVMCNKLVKFKPFIEYADMIGADYYATGHYANVIKCGDKYFLCKAHDKDKDQSYFLNQLTQQALSKAIFPLGKLKKSEVKELAQNFGLANYNRKESYDVCFLGSLKLGEYFEGKIIEKSGDIVDFETGKIVGKHTGLSKYTLGQRKGLGIGGGHGSTGECWFVVDKDLNKNVLYVSEGNSDALYSEALICNDFNWITGQNSQSEFECFAKFRYRQNDQRVKVKIIGDKSILVKFIDRQRAITAGQYVVLYDEGNDLNYQACLGGGQIDEVIKHLK